MGKNNFSLLAREIRISSHPSLDLHLLFFKKGDGFSHLFCVRTLAKLPHQNTLAGAMLRLPNHNI